MFLARLAPVVAACLLALPALAAEPLTDPKRSSEGFLVPIGDCKGYGLNVIIGLLAGVLAVPEERYEAAALDGGDGWRRRKSARHRSARRLSQRGRTVDLLSGRRTKRQGISSIRQPFRWARTITSVSKNQPGASVSSRSSTW